MNSGKLVGWCGPLDELEEALQRRGVRAILRRDTPQAAHAKVALMMRFGATVRQ